MQVCTHLSRFALVSMVFPGRNAKKYTGYCIIACVPMCLTFTLKMLQSKNFGKEDIVKEPYAQEGCLSRSITPPRG